MALCNNPINILFASRAFHKYPYVQITATDHHNLLNTQHIYTSSCGVVASNKVKQCFSVYAWMGDCLGVWVSGEVVFNLQLWPKLELLEPSFPDLALWLWCCKSWQKLFLWVPGGQNWEFSNKNNICIIVSLRWIWYNIHGSILSACYSMLT